MTPEPAQPVESPEARWLGCTLPPEGWWCSREEGHEGPCAARPDEAPEEDGSPLSDADKARIDAAWESYKPLLAATTARPTERGAVEAMREACAQAVEGLKRKTPYEYNVAPCQGTMKRAVDAIRALTPPVTVAATDQARRDRIAKAVLDGWYEGNEEWDSPRNDMLRMRAYWAADAVLALPQPATDQAGEVECNCAARFYGDDRNAHQLCCAALDTQPATGRTMGGEDKQAVVDLHALQHDGTTLASKPTWGGSIIRWAVDEIKGLRAALQNGVE